MPISPEILTIAATASTGIGVGAGWIIKLIIDKTKGVPLNGKKCDAHGEIAGACSMFRDEFTQGNQRMTRIEEKIDRIDERIDVLIQRK
jgi:hypothetical protein